MFHLGVVVLIVSIMHGIVHPHRWLDPNPDNRPTLLGFGYGPHTCIGVALYIIEAKTVCASTLFEAAKMSNNFLLPKPILTTFPLKLGSVSFLTMCPASVI